VTEGGPHATYEPEMSHTIAFLRAINVGGRTVKMDELRRHLQALGLTGVETFIASGNVIFDTPDEQREALERRLEAHLERSLGFTVDTFVRSAAEVAELATYAPWPPTPGDTLYIAFLKQAPGDDAARAKELGRRLAPYRNEVDDFHVHAAQVYWRCRKTISQSEFSGALLEKALGAPATLRNVTTVRKLAAKYPPR
jgi:uncharacterized protein (DUF1697 family)